MQQEEHPLKKNTFSKLIQSMPAQKWMHNENKDDKDKCLLDFHYNFHPPNFTYKLLVNLKLMQQNLRLLGDGENSLTTQLSAHVHATVTYFSVK